MSFYRLGKIHIHDVALYARYEEDFREIMDKYKGRILSVDQRPRVLERDRSRT